MSNDEGVGVRVSGGIRLGSLSNLNIKLDETPRPEYAYGTKSCEVRMYKHHTASFISWEFNSPNRQCPRILAMIVESPTTRESSPISLPYHHESRPCEEDGFEPREGSDGSGEWMWER